MPGDTVGTSGTQERGETLLKIGGSENLVYFYLSYSCTDLTNLFKDNSYL